MKFTSLIAALAATSLLSACAEQNGAPGRGVLQGGNINKADVGTLAGAIGGGIVGSNVGKGKGAIAGTIAGTLLGAAIGNSIGTSLDNADRAMLQQTSQRALETAQTGQALPWNNPQTGNSGTVTPKAPYKNPQGEYCREYTQTIKVGGKTEQAFGKACRQPDGTWQIVE